MSPLADSRPQPDSPNWHWQQLGYSVERTGQRRTIRRPDGSAVEIDQREGERRHDAEVRAAIAERLTAVFEARDQNPVK